VLLLENGKEEKITLEELKLTLAEEEEKKKHRKTQRTENADEKGEG
jgi:hypothetical protein